MYTNRFQLEEYPYRGVFYTVTIDESKPLDQQVETRKVLLTTQCDIVESSHTRTSDAIWSDFTIFFPFDNETDKIKIKVGNLFEANVHGMKVDGKVIGIFPSQLGGVTVYIQDKDI